MPEGTPTDMILAYRQQGYDDQSISQYLQQQGYTSQQIYDGMNQADQKQQQLQPSQNMDDGYDNTESLVESIVQEKWKSVQTTIQELKDWKDQTNAKFTQMEESLKNLKEQYDKLHEGVLGKIGEYDNNLKEVGSSIQAMDQVFKKVLPTLTDSVNKLSKLSDKS